MKTVCSNLIELQELRHTADYDFSVPFTKSTALDACAKAQEAMEAWGGLKNSHSDALSLFAMAILLWPGLSAR